MTHADLLHADTNAPEYPARLADFLKSLDPTALAGRDVPLVLESRLEFRLDRCTQIIGAMLPQGLVADGPGILLRDDIIRQQHPGPQGARQVVAVAVHELAHVLLENGTSWTLSDTLPEYVGNVLERLSDRLEQIPVHLLPWEPWHNHEYQFIRACCHLAARAQRAGLDIDAAEIVDCRSYELSRTADYEACLLGEPFKYPTSRPIAEIIATPPRAPFLALWEEDTTQWRAEHTPATPAVVAAGEGKL